MISLSNSPLVDQVHPTNLEYTCTDFNNEFNSNVVDNFIILNQNIRSFKSNGPDLIMFLNELNPDISVIILTETWFKPDNIEIIPNYNGYHSYRPMRMGGGVSIFVKNTLTSCSIPEVTFCNENLESCGVKVSIGNNHKFINIVGLYRPPNGNCSSFHDILRNNVLSKFSTQQQVCISGDMNLNLLNFDDPYVQEYSDILETKSFLPQITIPTRTTNTSATLLDHTWTNILSASKSGLIASGLSDHCATFTCFHHMAAKQNFIQIKFRDTSQQALNEFQTKLNERLLDFDLINIHDLNSKVVDFRNILWNTFEECCPARSKTITRNRLLSPWLTKNIIFLSRIKRSLFTRARSNAIPHQMFVDFSKELKKIIKLAKIKYFNSKFAHLKNDIKKTWNNINQLIGKPKQCRSIKIIKDNELISDPSQIASAFNEHFSSVAPKI